MLDPFVILCIFVVFLLFDEVISTEKIKEQETKSIKYNSP